VRRNLSTTRDATIAFDKEATMQVTIKRRAGLDVHQATVVARVIIHGRREKPTKEVRTFGTMTHEPEALRDWLKAEGVTHAGMDSTGVYWRPVHAVLEDHFTLIVGNARHIRDAPGRETDVKDAEWIATLECYGLIQPSFVPPKPLRELRELLRYRRKLVEGRNTGRNRPQKLLETAGIKLGSVATDVLACLAGPSGAGLFRMVPDEACPREGGGRAMTNERRCHDVYIATTAPWGRAQA
jgi:transposase